MLSDDNLDITLAGLAEIKKHVGDRETIRLLGFGIPDIFLSPGRLIRTFRRDIIKELEISGISEAELVERSINRDCVLRIDPLSFYRAQSFDPTFVDLFSDSRDALKLDINLPIDSSYHARFDAVIDGGTLEHCFNVAQALKNMASCLNIGGVINHGNPIMYLNHGFYNFSPIFYTYFYNKNKFDICSAMALYDVRGGVEVRAMPATTEEIFSVKDLRSANVHSYIFCRRTTLDPIAWPYQGVDGSYA